MLSLLGNNIHFEEKMSPKQAPKNLIKIIMPNGQVIERDVVLTLDNVGDPTKTTFRMYGASSQMLLSAKNAAVIDFSDLVNMLLSEKIEVQGNYKTDLTVYYAPSAFGGEKAVNAVNGVYADRLRKLEKTVNELREHKSDSSDFKLSYNKAQKEIFDLKRKINVLARLAKSGNGLPAQNGKEEIVSKQEYQDLEKRLNESDQLNENYNLMMVDYENRLLEKEKEVEQIGEQLLQSISPAQHSTEMERLKDEYDGVNQRAISGKPALITKGGIRRYMDLEEIVQLKPNEKEGLVEGQHVLIVTENGKRKVEIGRLYFNDTKDYICLGQGLDISRIMQGIPELTEAEAVRIVKNDNLQIPTYLMAVTDLASQTAQLWLHKIKENQKVRIYSIDEPINELLKKTELNLMTSQEFVKQTEQTGFNFESDEISSEDISYKLQEEQNVALRLYNLIGGVVVNDPLYKQEMEQANIEKNKAVKTKMLNGAEAYKTSKISKIASHMYDFAKTDSFKPSRIYDLPTDPNMKLLKTKYNGALDIVPKMDIGDAEQLKRNPDILQYIINPEKLKELKK